MSGRPKLIVGLGNPGREYAGTRHNIGFAVLDRLAWQWKSSFRSKWRFSADVAEPAPADLGKVWLAKPRTFMNRSGVAVVGLLRWRKLAPADLLVVLDDADLPLGQIRLREAGGSGGHNGLRSVIEALGGREDFARLRVGIGRHRPVGEDITGHVLGEFGPRERSAAEEAVNVAAEAVACCVREGLTTAMNQFNRRKLSPNQETEGERD